MAIISIYVKVSVCSTNSPKQRPESRKSEWHNNEAGKCSLLNDITRLRLCLGVARGCVLEFAFDRLGVLTTHAS